MDEIHKRPYFIRPSYQKIIAKKGKNNFGMD